MLPVAEDRTEGETGMGQAKAEGRQARRKQWEPSSRKECRERRLRGHGRQTV